MEFIGIILSSTVIVAIIQFFQGNKGNHLQYITMERTEWRKSMKEIIQDVNSSNLKNIQKPLAALKSNLNGYGYHALDQYPATEKLDYMADEHIWLEIEKIEKAVKRKDKNAFECHKEKLIIGLIMLLKFDWERSKKEVYGGISIPIAIFLFLFGMLLAFIAKFGISGMLENMEECVRWGLVMLYLYSMAWLPCMLERPKAFRLRKWYRNLNVVVVPVVFFFLFEFIFNTYMADVENGLEYVSQLVCIVSFAFIMMYPVISEDVYREYDNKLIEVFSDAKLHLYTSSWLDQLIPFYFSKYNFFVDTVDINKLDFSHVFSDPEIRNLIVLGKEQQFLRRGSRIKYLLKKWLARKQNRAPVNIRDFIEENHHRCKVVTEYISGSGEIKYSIGKKKKIWKEWFHGEGER